MLRKTVPDCRENGTGIVEVLVALAIAGTAIVMFLTSISTGSRSTGAMFERITAENLARSQLEYAKSQDYIYAPASYDTIAPGSPDFTVSCAASSVADRNNNIQKITVIVYRNEVSVLQVEDFKVNR